MINVVELGECFHILTYVVVCRGYDVVCRGKKKIRAYFFIKESSLIKN